MIMPSLSMFWCFYNVTGDSEAKILCQAQNIINTSQIQGSISMPKPPAMDRMLSTSRPNQVTLGNADRTTASKRQANVTRHWEQTTRTLHNIPSALTAQSSDVTSKVPQWHHSTATEG